MIIDITTMISAINILVAMNFKIDNNYIYIKITLKEQNIIALY